MKICIFRALDSGLRKTCFLKKKTTHQFFFKRNKIFFFSRKRKNPILNCFYCIMIMQYTIFRITQIITCYTYYGIIKIEGKKCTPSLFSPSVVGHFTPKWYDLASMHTANRGKPFPHKLCSFMSSLCACSTSSASIECLFQQMIWYGPKSRKI